MKLSTKVLPGLAILGCCSLLCAAGCSDSEHSTNTPVGPTTFQTLYYEGDLSDSVISLMKERGIDPVPYNGLQKNAPILFANGSVSEGRAQAAKSAADNGQAIFLMNTTKDKINDTIEKVFGSDSSFVLPSEAVMGREDCYLFGVKKDNGASNNLHFFTNFNSENEDTILAKDRTTGLDDETVGRVWEHVESYVEGDYDTPDGMSADELALDAAAKIDDNIFEVGSRYVYTASFNQWGKSFVVNNYLVGLHAYDNYTANGGVDYFFIQQESVLDASYGYAANSKGAASVTKIDNYISSYNFNAELVALSTPFAVDPEFVGTPQPVTTADAEEMTAFTGTDISTENGGLVGAFRTSVLSMLPFCTLSNSYGINSLCTFKSEGVDVVATQNDAKTKLNWLYTLSPAGASDADATRLAPGSVYGSTEVFKPVHQWIWRTPTSTQAAQYCVDLSFTPTIQSAAVSNTAPVYSTAMGSTGTVRFALPPRAYDNLGNVDTQLTQVLPPSGTPVTFEVSTQGVVKAETEADWLSVNDTSEKLYVLYYQDNPSAAERHADLTLIFPDGQRHTVKITQSGI